MPLNLQRRGKKIDKKMPLNLQIKGKCMDKNLPFSLKTRGKGIKKVPLSFPRGLKWIDKITVIGFTKKMKGTG